MPANHSKLSKFWQELKRRNVTRVLAVYIASAFMVLELISMTSEPFGLPEVTLKVAFIISLVGLVIVIIVSWIFDIQPEAGIVRTEAAQKGSKATAPPPQKSWKIASYISFVVIVALIVLNIIPRANSNRRDLEKSIAVLPLEYLSEDPAKEYLAKSVLDAITGHLSMIEGLRVMPRTSVEQYRDIKKTAKEIGEELDVSYLIEGKFLMIENQVKLTIQLVAAEEGDHLFFEVYQRDYKDIIAVESEIAKTIANEIEVALTPEVKLRIEKIPTNDLSAHDFYRRGREEHVRYQVDGNDSIALDKAENYYQLALDYDSSFALAYTGLAWVYWDMHYWDSFFSENFLDSILILADKSLSYDDELSDAYSIRGLYYAETDQTRKAINDLDKAIQLNPNDWIAYRVRGWLYRSIDVIESIKDYHIASSLNRGAELPDIWGTLALFYIQAGFIEKANDYYQEILKLDGDSAKYFGNLCRIEWVNENYEKGLEYAQRAIDLDPGNPSNYEMLGDHYQGLGQYDKSLESYEMLLEGLEAKGALRINNVHRLGYLYFKNGMMEEANHYFKIQIDYCNTMNELGREMGRLFWTYYDLAAVYAFNGDIDKAYENLRIFNQKQRITSFIAGKMRNDPLFYRIQHESEFQQIVSDVEAKYQAEHERVMKWLEENDML